MHPLLSIVITLSCLGAILFFSAWGTRSGRLSAEVARKAVHIGMGLLCMGFPWLFHSVLAVQILALCAIATLLLIRFSKLRRSVGSALFTVKRLSIGELLFPAAVAWLFTLGGDKPLLYCISLLLLTLADSAGALAGSRFGKKIYLTTAAEKSIEGSIAFFITAFFCTAVPLYFFSPLTPGNILLLSLTVALFTMAVEGASGHGLDNLLIPVGSYLLLDYYIDLQGGALLLRVIAFLFLLVLLLLTNRRHTLNGGALLAALLFGFAASTMGGVPCLIATLILFARHMQVQHSMPKNFLVSHSVETIVAIAIPCLTWLTLGRRGLIDYPHAQFGFIGTLAIISYMLNTGTQRHLNWKQPFLFTGFCLSLLVLSPALTLDIPLTYFGLVLLVGPPLAWAYFYWKTNSDTPELNHWLKLCFLASISSMIVMLFVLL